MTTKQKSIFIPGDEWVYFKIYTGFKLSDLYLAEIIYPLAKRFTEEGVVDKWFFIRYTDPNYHLRVRFHLTDTQYLSYLIDAVNQLVTPEIETDRIWKLQLETYQREMKRYGSQTMELSETIFYVDSIAIAEIVGLLYGADDEMTRWLLSMKMIDNLLVDFELNVDDRLLLLEGMKNGFAKEFNMDNTAQRQLSAKYRTFRAEINSAMKGEFETQFCNLLIDKSKKICSVASEISSLCKQSNSDVLLEDLLISYIHMMLNRLFRTNQRKYEMVIYDLLQRYYLSVVKHK